ncbi:MAG TPA: TolC family protein [Pseudolabrys sp.]|jgi:outer membrane protein TolC|nr:TolC family protein [Pseudolabrys sp.]
MTFPRLLASLGAALLTSACVSFSPDGGMDVPTRLAKHELRGDVVHVRSEDDTARVRAHVARLIKKPLTADAAVQIALLNNRGLQAAYDELGIAEAVRVQQSLPPNPTIQVTRLAGPAETEIDRQIVASIVSLATLPARTEIAADRFRQAQLAAALETLRVAAEARRSYIRAVAARRQVGLLEQANGAAATTTELTKRLGETGAMNKLDQARELAFHAELTTQLASARQRADAERERLIRALGLWGGDLAFKLPDRLPAVPGKPRALPQVEQDAVSRRVDLQMARMDAETLAKSYGLTKATRFVNVLDAGYADKITRNKDTGERAHDRGFTVSLEVPLFDFGEGKLREAEATYMQAINRLAEKAVNVRSEAREAYRNYRATYDIARHYQKDVLPLRNTISDEMMLRYGAMQVDVFALLAEARQKIAVNGAAADALRDFWLASADLSAVVTGGGAGGGSESASVAMPASGASGH